TPPHQPLLTSPPCSTCAPTSPPARRTPCRCWCGCCAGSRSARPPRRHKRHLISEVICPGPVGKTDPGRNLRLDTVIIATTCRPGKGARKVRAKRQAPSLKPAVPPVEPAAAELPSVVLSRPVWPRRLRCSEVRRGLRNAFTLIYGELPERLALLAELAGG